MDAEKGPIPWSKDKFTDVFDPGDDAAAAKIWAVYVDEAEKYDKGLIESWKGDMEGMLIFAGLFSASLTAFLIESYKTLNSDPGDATVRLLTQISHQLAASANGTTFHVPAPVNFAPTAAALTCNALWFISLGFSLSCALIATLLEQWARDFIHRSEIKSAPLLRARIFSFLYYGLKRFNMHAVVEVIPLLLHVALLFFFAGLVAFLIPINTAMAVIAAVILAVLTSVYSVLTLLPLKYLDSPYRTPLSGTFWRIFHSLNTGDRHPDDGAHPATGSETIVEAIFRAATQPSEERRNRDEQALVWTVKSLSDDLELEPFVEAIPDILWSAHGRRFGYEDLFRNVFSNVALYGRIRGLFLSCETGLLSPQAATRRQIICYKAAWAIMTLLESPDSVKTFLESIGPWASLSSRTQDDPELLHYSRSVETLIQWRSFQIDQLRLEENMQYLVDCQAAAYDGADEVDVTPVVYFMDDLTHNRSYFVDIPRGLPWHERNGKSSVAQIPVLIETLQHILTTTPYLIFFPFLRNASNLESLPYFFRQTVEIIRPPPGTPSAVRHGLDETLHMVVARMMKYNPEGENWLDTVMQELLPYWPHPEEEDSAFAALSPALIRYLNHRTWDKAVLTAMTCIPFPGRRQFWHALTGSLSHAAEALDESAMTDLLTAIWRLETSGISSKMGVLSRDFIEIVPLKTSSVGLSVIALLKSRYLNALIRTQHSGVNADPAERFMDPILPPVTIAVMPSDSQSIHRDNPRSLRIMQWQMLEIRVAEAYITLFAQFLQSCADSDPLPYKAVATLKSIAALAAVEIRDIHETHQIQLATAIQSCFADCVDLRTVVLNSSIFDVYTEPPIPGTKGWLDNIAARETIAATLECHADALAPYPDDFAAAQDLVQVRAILAGLSSVHSEEQGTFLTTH
ncbi:hypothetical protein B0H16DRAFT_1367076 [Mycena metata]|uniref:DUF6535 domain-containing protein n=1 Tax=Mycena metata TaxID=1033252 RepID=A0AAD7JJT8_9AGAR|nr:hypothetical protein B0H16DRAFT_1367076 [Mycena metata]